jgi:hypothetical protein
MIEKRRNFVFRFLPGLFLSGLLLLSGCSQDDVSDIPAGSRAIGFRAQGAMSSLKATTTSKDNIQSFVVSANHGGDWTVADNYLIPAATVYREGGIGDPGATAKWTYSPQAYFPTDKSSFVEFLAYSPAVSKNVTAGLKDAVDADQTITYTVPKPLATGVTSQEDFLVAYQQVTGSADPGYGGPVNLQFRHALSRVLVAAASSLTEPVTITGLVLRNLYTTGDLPMNSASTVWDPAADLDDYSYILPPAGVSVFQYPVLSPPSSLPLVTSYEQGMFVLPQTTAGTLTDAETAEIAVENSNEFGLELHYTIGGLVKEPYYIQFGDLAAPTSGPGVTFEPGKQYVLNLTFGAGSGTGGGPGGSDQPSVDIGATISFGELGVDGYGPDIAVPKPKAFELVPAIWSQSNVYYDETADAADGVGALTFSESDDTKNLYQGIYFKWGSLVGVSVGTNWNNFLKTDYLFIPGSDGKYHKVQVSDLVANPHSDPVVAAFQSAVGSIAWGDLANDDQSGTDARTALWGGIPYTDLANISSYTPASPPGRTSRDDNGLTEATGTAVLPYSSYKGDVCKYLVETKATNGNSSVLTSGLKWRLPTSNEFSKYSGGSNADNDGDAFVNIGTDDHYSTKWKSTDPAAVGEFEDASNGNIEDGAFKLKDNLFTYYRLNWVSSGYEPPLFPASGYRGNTDGGQFFIGGNGYYWSSSAFGGSYAYILYFSSGYVYPYSNGNRTNGFSVRCVRDGENVAP